MKSDPTTYLLQDVEGKWIITGDVFGNNIRVEEDTVLYQKYPDSNTTVWKNSVGQSFPELRVVARMICHENNCDPDKGK
jgi:hypothetical protein